MQFGEVAQDAAVDNAGSQVQHVLRSRSSTCELDAAPGESGAQRLEGHLAIWTHLRYCRGPYSSPKVWSNIPYIDSSDTSKMPQNNVGRYFGLHIRPCPEFWHPGGRHLSGAWRRIRALPAGEHHRATCFIAGLQGGSLDAQLPGGYRSQNLQ